MDSKVELMNNGKMYYLDSNVAVDQCLFTSSDFNDDKNYTFLIDEDCSLIREISLPDGLSKILVDDSINTIDCKLEVIHLPSTVKLSSIFSELEKIKSLLLVVINPAKKIRTSSYSLGYTICSLNSIEYPKERSDSANSNPEMGYYNYIDNDVVTIPYFKVENLYLIDDCYYYLKENNQYELIKVRNKYEIIVKDEIDGIKVSSIFDGAFKKFEGSTIHLPATIHCEKDLIDNYSSINIVFYNQENKNPNDEYIEKQYEDIILNVYERMKSTKNISCSYEDYLKGSYNYISQKDSKEYDIEIVNGLCTIKKCKLDDEVIVIPERINGYQIVYLGSSSFSNLNNLKRLIMPNSIIGIYKNAFQSCVLLNNIKFSKNIQIIHKTAFHNCLSLNELFIPKSLINKDFFECCEHNNEYGNIDNEKSYVTRIKNSINFNRSKRPDFYFEVEDEVIKGEQFDFEYVSKYYDYSLDYRDKKVVLSKEGYYYFLNRNNEAILTHGTRYYNFNLKQIVLPDTLDGYPLVAIGNFAFEDAVFLEMHFPNSLREIGYGAFLSAIYNVLYLQENIDVNEYAFGSKCYVNLIGEDLISNLERQNNLHRYLNNLRTVVYIKELSNDNINSVIRYNKVTGCTYRIENDKAIILNIDHTIDMEEFPSSLDGIQVNGVAAKLIKYSVKASSTIVIPEYITKIIDTKFNCFDLNDLENIVLPKKLKELTISFSGSYNNYFIVPYTLEVLNILDGYGIIVIPFGCNVKINGEVEFLLKGFEKEVKLDGITYFLYKEKNKSLAFAYGRYSEEKDYRFISEIEDHQVVGADLNIRGENFVFEHLNFDGSNIRNMELYMDLDDEDDYELYNTMSIEPKYSDNYFKSFHFKLNLSNTYRISGKIKKINNIRNFIWPLHLDEDNEINCKIILEEGIEEINEFYSNEITFKDANIDEYVPKPYKRLQVRLPKSLKRVGKNALRFCRLDDITLYDTTILEDKSVDKWSKLIKINDKKYIKDDNRLEYVRKCISIFNFNICKPIIEKVKQHNISYDRDISSIKPIVIQMAKEIFESWNFENITSYNKSIHLTVRKINGEAHNVQIIDAGKKLIFLCDCKYVTWYGCTHSIASVIFIKEYYNELIYLCDHLTGFEFY